MLAFGKDSHIGRRKGCVALAGIEDDEVAPRGCTRDELVEQGPPVSRPVDDGCPSKAIDSERKNHAPADAKRTGCVEREQIRAARSGAHKGGHGLCRQSRCNRLAHAVAILEREARHSRIRRVDPASGYRDHRCGRVGLRHAVAQKDSERS